MTYEETLQFLYVRHTSIYRGLERIRYILEKLGNPQETFPSVLITGTNGKGSTAKIISRILRAAGYRVGCFTSPHLVDFGERITINGEYIPQDEVVALAEEIINGPMKQLEQDREKLQIEGIVSFFEIVTAMGFLYFSRQHVDIAVLEVGIGGRLDATNTSNPLVSIITTIGLEHQDLLGDTISAIAREKSAIIREYKDVVISRQQPEALAVIEETCREKNALLHKTGVYQEDADLAIYSIPQKISSNGSVFCYQGIRDRFEDFYIPLVGVHQISNATIALATIEILNTKGFYIDENAIRAGLAHVIHPGRLEMLDSNPTIVVDIAHNFIGAATIADTLTSVFEYDKLIVVIGVLYDKDVQGILRPFLQVADGVIFTSPHNTPRAKAASETAKVAEQLIAQGTITRTDPRHVPEKVSHVSQYTHWLVCKSVQEAIQQARTNASKKDLICITGSNYTVSEAELCLKNKGEA